MSHGFAEAWEHVDKSIAFVHTFPRQYCIQWDAAIVVLLEVLVESKKSIGRIYSPFGDNEEGYLWFGLLCLPLDAYSLSIAATDGQVVGQLFTKKKKGINIAFDPFHPSSQSSIHLRNPITEEGNAVRNAIFPRKIGNCPLYVSLEIFNNFLTRLLDPSRSGPAAYFMPYRSHE